MNDTICAIATSQGVGAIAIIRISGEDSIKIVNKIFKGKDLEKVESHTINYGHITDGDKIIDEVLVSVMKAPKTFTAEDTVEINTHGGISPTNKVLELLLENGCRLAEPGEFTKRAFLNGRIDLLEAEAVMDMINSKTDAQRQMAINQIGGKVSDLINSLRSDMVQIISNINVNIDYPEYDDVDIITNEILIPKITSLKARIEKILKESENGKIIKEGIKTSIVGRPNVGKSSLLNALLEEDKAIVTDIAGTTRDVVEGSIRLNDIVLNMIDTAGIRETEDKIEHMGVKKSLSLIDQADLVLVVLDGSRPIEAEDKELLERTEGLNRIVLINKSDKGCVIDTEGIHISAKENHIDELIQHIKDEFDFSAITNSQAQVLANQRQVQLLEKASQSLNVAIQAMEDGIPTDLIVTDLYDSWENLKEILGEQAKEDLLDELFKRFCIGK